MQLVFNTKANLSRDHCLSNLSATRVTTHRSQIGMSTAVNMTVKALCKEQCLFVVYSTYLMPSRPCNNFSKRENKRRCVPYSILSFMNSHNNFSCSCTPCVLYWLPQGTILVNSCNSGDKCNCQNNKCFFSEGRFTLKQYMPLKPVRRGIKVWALADSLNGYISEFEVYTGKKEMQ